MKFKDMLKSAPEQQLETIEPVVLFFNTTGHYSDSMKLSKAQPAFNDLLQEHINLGLPKINTINELIFLLRGGDAYIHDTLEQEMPDQVVAGFKISKKKAITMLELPDTSRLNALREAALEYDSYSQYLTTDGTKVEISPNADGMLRKHHSKFAKTPDQIKLYQSHQALVDAMKTFNDQHIAVFGSAVDDRRELSEYVRVAWPSIEHEPTEVPAVKRMVERDGKQFEEIVTPNSILKNFEQLPPVVSMNPNYYGDRWLPELRHDGV